MSGDLNEHRIAEIVRVPARRSTRSASAPSSASSRMRRSFAGVYKLAEYAGKTRAKRSPEKETLGGRKQVWRREGLSDLIAATAKMCPVRAPCCLG